MSYLLISIISEKLALLLPTFGLILAGYLVEKNFVGRIAIFANTLALNSFFYFVPTYPLVEWYVNIGLIFGLVAIISYATKFKLHSYFYKASYIYCSIAVGLVILAHIF